MTSQNFFLFRSYVTALDRELRCAEDKVSRAFPLCYNPKGILELDDADGCCPDGNSQDYMRLAINLRREEIIADPPLNSLAGPFLVELDRLLTDALAAECDLLANIRESL